MGQLPDELALPKPDNNNPQEEAEYLEAAAFFLKSTTTTKEAIQDGLRFHRAQPLITEPTEHLVPSENEVLERLQLARRAYQLFREAEPRFDLAQESCDLIRDGLFQCNMLHIAVFMELPLDKLRFYFKSKVTEKKSHELFDALKLNENLMALCMYYSLSPPYPLLVLLANNIP